MNILVTGGAGYIGSHVVKQLGEFTNHDITIVDDLSTGKESSVLFGELIKMNLSEYAKLEQLFINKKFDAVIHFAASIIVHESVENPLKYYINNTVNTTNLINLCIKHDVNKFIFSSSAAVYGEPDEIPVTENTCTKPINPYGTTKLISELILKDTAKAHKDFKYVALRYFNVAGADLQNRIGESCPLATHLVKVAAQTAIGKRNKISIFGDDFNTPDGTCIRDYVHVEDLADAHLKALEYIENNDSNIFNCGYNKGYSVKEVIQTMQKVSGIDFPVEITPRRDGDPAILIADSTKIMKIMNWQPKYNDIELICKTALDWEKK